MPTFADLPSATPSPPPPPFSPPLLSASAHADYVLTFSPPRELICPITQEIFSIPVLAPDGHTYEKAAVVRWHSNSEREDFVSPVSNEVVECEGVVVWVGNKTVKAMCANHVERVNEVVRRACGREEIKNWTDAEKEGAEIGRILPLFEVGGATGEGRCEDGNGVCWNIIESGLIHPRVVSEIVSTVGGASCINGGWTQGSNVETTCVDQCLLQMESSVGKIADEWRSVSERIEREVKAENRKEEARRAEQSEGNANWRVRQQELRRRQGGGGTSGGGRGGAGDDVMHQIGYFPSLVALQFSNVPPPEGGGMEDDEIGKRKQLAVIVRVLFAVVAAFFFLA